ncbi:MAG: hypothetical protein SWK90_10360 [Chloroflexota bacterium]|nr:hypothetical protein [Chloroflexota bacterium]
MTQWHRPLLWFVLALAVVLIAAVGLWLRGTLPGNGGESPLPIPLASGVSPLATPTPAHPASLPASWTGAGAALLWTVLGAVLALGVAFVILHRYSHTT